MGGVSRVAPNVDSKMGHSGTVKLLTFNCNAIAAGDIVHARWCRHVQYAPRPGLGGRYSRQKKASTNAAIGSRRRTITHSLRFTVYRMHSFRFAIHSLRFTVLRFRFTV